MHEILNFIMKYKQILTRIPVQTPEAEMKGSVSTGEAYHRVNIPAHVHAIANNPYTLETAFVINSMSSI
jgi:hypothetical protein